MKRLLIIIAAALALTSCIAINVAIETGNGVPVTTDITVGDFDALSIPSSIDVIYTQTPGQQSLTFTCDQNLQEYYDIRVENKVLVVSTKRGVVAITPRVKTFLVVNSPVLNSVKISGSGDCEINSPITAKGDFSLSISGSGDINLNGQADCKAFSATTSGSGDIAVIAVVSQSAEVRSSGSGDIGIDAIKAGDIEAKTTGSGDIVLVCDGAGDIEASTSGSGSIVLSGTAHSLSQRSSGSGRVDARNLFLN